MGLLTGVEAAATILGFLCVWLFIQQRIWAWPAAGASAVLFGVVFYDAALFANMGLQGVYVILAFYGWNQWRRGGADQAGVSVQHITARLGVTLGALVVFCALLLVGAAHWAIDGAVPQSAGEFVSFLEREPARSLDALATALSLAGTWMQAKKILENWLVWIGTDLLLVGVFLSQGLYFTTALYLVYLVMATIGYRTWRKDLHP